MPRRLLAYATPDQVTGLTAWFKADSLALSDGAAVSSWTDSSGNSNTATQATGGAQPIFKKNIRLNLPVVRFSGSNHLTVANPTTFNLATYSLFIVALSTSGSGDLLAKNQLSADNARRKLQVSLSSTQLTFTAGNDGAPTLGATATTTSFNVFGIIGRGNSNHDLIVNGTVTNATSTLFDDTYGTTALEIGAAFGNGAEGFTGDIAEIIIYNTPLSTSNMTAVSNYLAIKYALTNNILGGYPRTTTT